MSNADRADSSFLKFTTTKRSPLKLSVEELVKKRLFDSDSRLPLIVEPAANINLTKWASNNPSVIEADLAKHGAILFRGFNVNSAEKLEEFIVAVSGEALKYNERSSPRSQVSGGIYTSTDYPANASIFPHNEQSYNLVFTQKIYFCCILCAAQGGETPVVDCRNIFNRISPKIRERFIERRYMYVRNFREHLGLSWQTAFQTTDKSVVENYCCKNDIEFEWREEDSLRTRQVRRAVAKHPRTGEMVWFNHLTFFHVSTLDPAVRGLLLSQYAEEDLPNNTYYGDGSPIEPSILDELRAAYLAEKVIFKWQEGDVLMLDNMLIAHAREPFLGERKVIVGMAEQANWNSIPF
jgi:alpha-ketoglutarate-dependent taurine dioxygenase